MSSSSLSYSDTGTLDNNHGVWSGKSLSVEVSYDGKERSLF